MELKELIKDVLEQMAEVKGTKYKKRYLVEEIEFELSLSKTKDGKIGASLIGISGEGNFGFSNEQKVRVKLIPKNNQDQLTMQV